MKILYIHQYFRTPYEPGASRSYWISREFIKNGHEVTMLTSNSNQKKMVERKEIDHINIISIKVTYDNKMGIFRRLIAYCNFMFLACFVGLKEKKFDFVYATSTPLTVGFPALLLKKIRRIPFVFEVRDLWPEVPIQMGAIKNRLIKKLAIKFEYIIYKNALHIIALSPGMKEGVIKQGVIAQKVSMIPNMAKIDKFWPRQHDEKLLKKYNLKKESFKVVYFGSFGLANGIDYVIDAITEFKNDDSVEFVFIGEGKMGGEIKRRKEKENLNNIHFLGLFNMEGTSKIVNLCDVSLVTFSDLPILATNSPNKLFDSLSAGKPIIVNNPGWTKDLVENNKCGIYADCKSSSDLAQKIIYLKKNPEIVKKFSFNSRKIAIEKYDKSILCKQVIETINKLNI